LPGDGIKRSAGNDPSKAQALGAKLSGIVSCHTCGAVRSGAA
jgi:hypothetical protein